MTVELQAFRGCLYFSLPKPFVSLCIVSFSAGVGRTGTFITLDAMMERLKEKDNANIFEFVSEMRTRRKQMVQTMVRAVHIYISSCVPFVYNLPDSRMYYT